MLNAIKETKPLINFASNVFNVILLLIFHSCSFQTFYVETMTSSGTEKFLLSSV